MRSSWSTTGLEMGAWHGFGNTCPGSALSRTGRIAGSVRRETKASGSAAVQGIRISRGRHVLILDIDTVPQPGSLDTLLQTACDHPAAGVVAPRLVGLDGQLQLSARRFPTVLSKILRQRAQLHTQGYLASENLAHWSHDHLRYVDYVIGAAQLLNRDALAEIGLFDERIFYGPEDVDLCLRMWQGPVPANVAGGLARCVPAGCNDPACRAADDPIREGLLLTNRYRPFRWPGLVFRQTRLSVHKTPGTDPNPGRGVIHGGPYKGVAERKRLRSARATHCRQDASGREDCRQDASGREDRLPGP